MSPVERPVAAMQDAIAVDEIGLSFGLFQALRLKTVFQPIFARHGPMLSPCAVSTGLKAESKGAPAPAEALAQFTSGERAMLRRLNRRLAIRNLGHFGCEEPDVDLLIGLSGTDEDADAEADALLADSALAGLMRGQVCFDLTDLADMDATCRLAARLERIGSTFALDLEAAGLLRTVKPRLQPRLVRIPPVWTRRIVAEAGLLRMLRLLVTTLAGRGTAVQVEGIDDAKHLRAALAAGAERLQGDFLAQPAVAGTAVDDAPLSIADLLGASGNVVSLSA